MNPSIRQGTPTAASYTVLAAFDGSRGPKSVAFPAPAIKSPHGVHYTADADADATVAAPLEQVSAMDSDELQTQQMCIEGLLSRDAFDHVRVGALARITLAGQALNHFSCMDGEVVAVDQVPAPGSGNAATCCRVRVLAGHSFFVHGTTYYPLLPGVAVRLAIPIGGRIWYPIMQTVQQWLP